MYAKLLVVGLSWNCQTIDSNLNDWENGECIRTSVKILDCYYDHKIAVISKPVGEKFYDRSVDWEYHKNIAVLK